MTESTVLGDQVARLRRASLDNADPEEVARARRLFAKSQASPEEELRLIREMRGERSEREEVPPETGGPPPYESGDPGPADDGR